MPTDDRARRWTWRRTSRCVRWGWEMGVAVERSGVPSQTGRVRSGGGERWRAADGTELLRHGAEPRRGAGVESTARWATGGEAQTTDRTPPCWPPRPVGETTCSVDVSVGDGGGSTVRAASDQRFLRLLPAPYAWRPPARLGRTCPMWPPSSTCLTTHPRPAGAHPGRVEISRRGERGGVALPRTPLQGMFSRKAARERTIPRASRLYPSADARSATSGSANHDPRGGPGTPPSSRRDRRSKRRPRPQPATRLASGPVTRLSRRNAGAAGRDRARSAGGA